MNEHTRQNIIIQRIARKYQRGYAKTIYKTMVNAANAIEKGQPFAYYEYEHKQDIKHLTDALYLETAERFVPYHATPQKSKYGPRIFKFNIPVNVLVGRIISEWAAEHAGLLITEISATTMQDIRGAIESAYKDGLNERELGTLIKKLAPNKSASRAQTIARTEVHRSASASGYITNLSSPFERVKVWNSGGQRVRDTHRDADNQRRAMQEAFDVGGDKLMYPVDPRGSAEETINCRCVLTYDSI